MSDLRTRIAAVIHKQNVSEYCGTIHPEDVLRLADAVIRELGEQECPLCSHVYRLEDHQ